MKPGLIPVDKPSYQLGTLREHFPEPQHMCSLTMDSGASMRNKQAGNQAAYKLKVHHLSRINSTISHSSPIAFYFPYIQVFSLLILKHTQTSA